MNSKIHISLVIPVYNESLTIGNLISTIQEQTLQPDEIILVDGGSTDNTVQLLKKITATDTHYRIIEAGRAMPGRGRNIGSENAQYEWIAYTDAGIKLENTWLEELVHVSNNNPNASIIYGNYSPIINTFFEKCATLAYVAPYKKEQLRGLFVASCLIKKEVWENVGGFLDLRAAEDLIFMERAEQLGFKAQYAPQAMVYWQLRQTISSTFKKFVLYSKYNVWAGRVWDWHYGIAKQYLVVVLVLILSIFNSMWWLLAIFVWLFFRTVKRILPHRIQFGFSPLFNPLIFFSVTLFNLMIDMATFIGWIQATFDSKNKIKI